MIVAATAADAPALEALLNSAGLPTQDLRADPLAHFLLYRRGESLLGAVGIDTAGEVGLLRSLVVAEAVRGGGIAGRLVNAAEQLAVSKGIRRLYLLTTTASDFFARRGYLRTLRSEAPAAIAAMPQFASLCPTTSDFMSKPMSTHHYNLLFLCTGNSARSILAEAAVNYLPISSGKFTAYSAGSFPKGEVNPYALELLQRSGIPTAGLRSKSWDEFAQPDAPKMDFIFTVCDQAAGEQCPYWPGQPMTAHWGLPDPAVAEGSDEHKRKAFADTFVALRRRIELFASLPFDKLDSLALQQQINTIGSQ
jgi:protein-tyrosine-phosphatase/N-acetylglutamate synthase-like GNAT family acetyltransferase